MCTVAIFRGAESAMPNSCLIRVGRIVATVVVAMFACGAQVAWGQASMGNILPNGLLPMLSSQPPADAVSTAMYQQPMNMPRRTPLARLIQNPDQKDGAPPFALTDQTGTIQRYIEPVPGIDLSSHVGEVVTVRNDTGTTLLASQLELPPQPLRAMVGNSDDRYATATDASGTWRRAAEPAGGVQQVQYVDNDDTTVQLLPDDAPGADPSAMATGGLMPLDGMPTGEFPAYGEQIGPPPMVGPMYPPNMPMPYPPGMMGYPTGGIETPPDRARLSAVIELMALRPQIEETAAGKLSEQLQFSPRIVLGLSGAGNFDGRLRYWRYDHDSDVLGTDGSVRIKFDVLDIEAIHHFAGRKSEVTLSAGLRLAGIHLRDIDFAECDTDLIGLTMAADGLTPLGMFPGGHFGLVYGGRLSILGGNWDGDANSQFVNQWIRNDNVLVNELYGGLELARRIHAFDVHVRFLFEMQNWRSDVLAQNAGIESIGMLGPGLQLGAEF
jgi:hypothetical protein